ncbi:MAG: inorganic diphosphatase, partial [Clostridiales bacterium]|nr:inorganic diphosphatase [Clostridiales bacterium]
ISHFFRVYKQLEGKSTTVFSVKSREHAELIIKENIAEYKKKFGK